MEGDCQLTVRTARYDRGMTDLCVQPDLGLETNIFF